MNSNIYTLKLHESTEIPNNSGIFFTITRVAGNWIYSHVRLDSNSETAVFVPFNNEF